MRILKDGVIYIAGELIVKSIPFLLIPYLSRKLGVEGYGELSYYQTYLYLFVIIIGLSQEAAVTRYYYFYGKRSILLILRACYFYTIISTVILFTVCFLVGSKILLCICIASTFQVMLTVQLSLRQCQKQAFQYVIIQLIASFVIVFLTVLMFEYYENELLNKRFLAILFGNAFAFLVSYFFFKKQEFSKKKFTLRHYKIVLAYMLSFGGPLILHNMSAFFKLQSDKLLIYHNYAEADLGVYAMEANLAGVISLLIMAVNKGTFPYYCEALKLKKIAVKNIYVWALYSLYLIPIVALVIFYVPESWFLLLLGTEFFGIKYYFLVFVISILFTPAYLLLANYLFYFGKNWYITICSIVSVFVYLIALLILSRVGIKFIPFASIIGSVSILPVLLVMVKKVSKEQ